MQSVQIAFTSSNGVIQYFDFGFIPSYIKYYTALAGSVLMYEFFRVLADKAVADGAAVYGQYGFTAAQNGDKTISASGSGILTYEEGEDVGVLIEHPGSGKKVIATVTDFATGTNYSSGARTASAIGTIVRPTVHNGYVYELTTETGSGTTEPTWPTIPGETITDGGSNVWTCRLEEIFKAGGQGFAIQATIADNTPGVLRAVLDDVWEDVGDVEGVNPIRFEKAKR